MPHNALYFFGYLGVFNGIILGIYLLFFNSKKQLSAYILGALLLALSIRIGKSVMYFFDLNISRTFLQIGLTACFFIGPLLYFFTKAETSQVRIMPRPWMKQLGVWGILIIATGIVLPYQHHPQLWGQYIIPVIYLQWGVHAVLSIIVLVNASRKPKEKSKASYKWLVFINAAVSIIFLCYVWAYLNITKGSYISGALGFSLAIYLVGAILLYRKKGDNIFASPAAKPVAKKTEVADAELIIDRLVQTMTEKSLFKNPDLKLIDLANEVNITSHQLSQVLNEKFNKNFTLFVNEYRINEACRILSRENNFSIDGIGEEVGFNSKSTFYATFKKLKGTTPAAFQQSISTDL